MYKKITPAKSRGYLGYIKKKKPENSGFALFKLSLIVVFSDSANEFLNSCNNTLDKSNKLIDKIEHQ